MGGTYAFSEKQPPESCFTDGCNDMDCFLSEFKGLRFTATAGAYILRHDFAAIGTGPGTVIGNIGAVIDSLLRLTHDISFPLLLSEGTLFFLFALFSALAGGEIINRSTLIFRNGGLLRGRRFCLGRRVIL